MKVTILGRPSHELYELAKFLFKKDYLKQVLCMKYPEDRSIKVYLKSIIYEKICSKFSESNKLRDYFSTTPSVIFIREFLEKAIFFIKKDRRKSFANLLSDRLFSKISCRRIRKLPSNIIYGWSPYSLPTFKYARKNLKHAHLFLELYMPHPDYVMQIYNKNFSKNQQSIFPPEKRGEIVNKECELADKIIVPSEFVKKSLKVITKIEDNKIEVIPFGTNTKEFYPIKKSKGFYETKKLEILFVGTICYEKGFDILFNSIEILKERNIEINLNVAGKVGEGYGKRFHKIKDRINYFGKLHHSHLNEIYNSVHYLVHPSFSESGPLVVYEALSSGLPCIVSDNARALIENGKNGYVFDTGSVNSLVSILKQCYNNRKDLIKLSFEARKTALENTWELRQKRIVDLFKSF